MRPLGMLLFFSSTILSFAYKMLRKGNYSKSKGATFSTKCLSALSVDNVQTKSESIKIYKLTIDELYKLDTRSCSKQLARHIDDTIFAKRKAFFQSTLGESGVKPTCKIVHVAGTKGKGSTVEYISAGLIAAGKQVGIFSSPHLHTARERVKFGRTLISIEEMIRFGQQTLAVFCDCPWSYVMFDKMLTVALLFFGEKDIDYMVLETGLWLRFYALKVLSYILYFGDCSGIGGRFDSTNFSDSPAACVITNISLDHQAILGNTLEEIAMQKV
jgi:hypothetical protein